MENMKPKTNETVRVELAGPSGNAFCVLGAMRRALRNAGLGSAEIDEYFRRATSGDYENLLAVSREYVNLVTV